MRMSVSLTVLGNGPCDAIQSTRERQRRIPADLVDGYVHRLIIVGPPGANQYFSIAATPTTAGAPDEQAGAPRRQ